MNRLKKIRDWFYFKENGDLKLYVESEDSEGNVMGQNYSIGGGGESGDVSDSTVTFSEDDDPDITSGSTLSTLFGKIQYFISTVLDSISDLFESVSDVESSVSDISETVSGIKSVPSNGNGGDMLAIPEGSSDDYGWYSKEALGIKFVKKQAWNGQWYWYKGNEKITPSTEMWEYSAEWSASDEITVTVKSINEYATWFTLDFLMYLDYPSDAVLTIDSVSDPNANASVSKAYDYMPLGLAKFSLENVTQNQEVTAVIKVTTTGYFGGFEIVGQEPYDILYRDPALTGYNYLIPANKYGHNGDVLKTTDMSSLVGFGWSSPSKAFSEYAPVQANLADSDLINGWLKFQMPHILSWYSDSSGGNLSGLTTMKLDLTMNDAYLRFKHPGITGGTSTDSTILNITDTLAIENLARSINCKTYTFPMTDTSNNTYCLGVVSFSADPTSDMIYVKLEKYVNGAISPIELSSSYSLYFE